MDQYVPSAVAALIVHNNQLLLGRRESDKGFEGWQCPGGFIDKGETIEQAVQRICLKKAGLKVGQLETGPYTNNRFPPSSSISHSITLYTIARQHKVLNKLQFENPDDDWQWFKLDALPDNKFLPLNILCSEVEITALLGS